jgi:peptide/nickel transport system permease protein
MRYLVKRLLAAIPVLFGVSVVVFAMLHLVPGDPVKMMLSEFQTSPEQIARLRAQLHLDEPLPQQFGRFLWNALHGDLGYSVRTRRPVLTEILENLPSTAVLALTGMVVAMATGVTLGVFAAVRQHSWFDTVSMLMALIGVSIPSFWLGLLLIFALSLKLGWLPATGGGDVQHLIMPALTLGLGASAIIARLSRSCMLEVLRQEYITTARAKGLRETLVILRHGLKNALIPVVTIIGLQLGQLLGGTASSRPSLRDPAWGV